ncbi:hypothetical protein [Labrys neptuniae]
MILFSASTNGFYLPGLHGGGIPDDAVEITVNEHRALLDGQTAGKGIAADDQGRPMLVERIFFPLEVPK